MLDPFCRPAVMGLRSPARPEADNLRLLAEFLAPFAGLALDDDCAQHDGQIRAELARVVGLKLEDWEMD